jgi:hypothetical protein
MRQLTSTISAQAPTLREALAADPIDQDGRGRVSSRLWTLIEALAYAGAYIDPSGMMAVQRLRQAQEEEKRRAGR